jgi:hypothetical protein
MKSAVHLKMLAVHLSNWGEGLPELLDDVLRENGSVAGGGCRRGTYTRLLSSQKLRLLLQQRRPMPSADSPLLPNLFHAAKAAKKMSPTIVLYGIVGLQINETSSTTRVHSGPRFWIWNDQED